MAKPITIGLIALVSLAAPRALVAETAEEMLAACRALPKATVTDDRVAIPQDFRSGVCWGAFGVIQHLVVMAYQDGRRIHRACAPAESTRTQLIAVFVKFADDHPERLHEPFLDVALASLQGAFPRRGSNN